MRWLDNAGYLGAAEDPEDVLEAEVGAEAAVDALDGDAHEAAVIESSKHAVIESSNAAYRQLLW